MLPFAAPPVLPRARFSGTVQRGNAYERRVGPVLRAFADSLGWSFYDHPWLHHGSTVCQPDFILLAPSGCVLVVEAKLTECDCTAQLRKYKAALAGWPCVAFQVARRVTSRPTVDCFENAVDGGLMLLWI